MIDYASADLLLFFKKMMLIWDDLLSIKIFLVNGTLRN